MKIEDARKIIQEESLQGYNLCEERENIENEVEKLTQLNVTVEPIRVDEYTQKKFTFFEDPDGLPIELYEE